MFLATSDPARQLLFLSYCQQVQMEELKRGREDMQKLLAGLVPGFRALADFSHLDSIDLDCAAEIGRAMEMLDQGGLATVVRVIPDPRRDIGMNILALFHYKHRPQTSVCRTMTEAAKALGL